MSDFKRDLRRYIDGLEEPVSVQETMNRRQERRFRVPAAVLAGAAIVMIPALVLIGIRFLPGDDGDVAGTTVPPISETSTTVAESTTTTAPTPTSAAQVQVPDLRGLSEDVARSILAEVGLELEVVDTYPAYDETGIMAQEPAANVAAAPGTVVRVDVAVIPRCDSIGPDLVTPADGEMVVRIWLQCGVSDFPAIAGMIDRSVPQSPDVITATLNALLAGPTEMERQDGYSSFFSPDSAGALNSVTLSGDRLTVDFNEAILINNASTSTGGLFFMAELQTNLFQFEQVDSIVFQIDGSCDVFWNWLQSDCSTVTRAEWIRQNQRQIDDIVEIVTPPGEYMSPGDLIGELVTTRLVNGSQFIMLASDPDTAWTGHTEHGGWLVSGETHVLTVPGADAENLWLVTRQGTTGDGAMVSRVEAILEPPWLDVFEDLQGDPFLFGAPNDCTLDGQHDARLVVIAEMSDPTTDATQPLYAWRINLADMAFEEIPLTGIECFAEVGG